MVVTAETLHSDLDSYLEYLLHVLTVKAEKLYARHLGKWVTVLAGSFLWLVGLIVIVAQCRLPPQLFMKIIVLLPILILFGAGVVLVTFHLLHDLCLPRRGYEDTFFFQAVPGARDARLSRVISLTYNPRCLWLLSCHCWQNAPAVCSNPGLSTALARKYGYISRQHRAHRWRDQHFPTLRSDQVEKFLFNSEEFLQRRSKENTGCCHRFLWCCLQDSTPPPHNHHCSHHQRHHDNHDPLNTYRQTISDARRKWGPRKRKAQNQVTAADKDSLEASSGYSSGQLRPTFQAKVEDEYMTPNLFVRKLAKESATPEQLLEDEICKIKKKKNRAQHPARPILLDNLHLPSVSPQQRFPAPADLAARGPALSRDDTEVDYGDFYQPHEVHPHRLEREYDPLTYGVRMSARREMAKDFKVWRY